MNSNSSHNSPKDSHGTNSLGTSSELRAGELRGSTRPAATLGGDSAEAMAKLYAEGGYLADDAALRAMACVKSVQDIAVVEAAIRCVYLPWLDDTARHFQECLAAKSLPAIEVTAGECVLFADGLRFDIGQRLASMGAERQLEASAGWQWAALPTVTATAKPAASPLLARFAVGTWMPTSTPKFPTAARSSTPIASARCCWRRVSRCSGRPKWGTAREKSPRVDRVRRVRQARARPSGETGGTDR